MKLENHESNLLSSSKERKRGKHRQQPSQHQICRQKKSHIRNFFENIRSNVKTSEVATLRATNEFGSFEKQLAPKFLFGYFLALLQHFVSQIFLGEELRVVHVACHRHHKTRSGPPTVA